MDSKNRWYRTFKSGDLQFYRVKLEQSDLYIGTRERLDDKAREACKEARDLILAEIRERPEFLTSLESLEAGFKPYPVDGMYRFSALAGVGPMASVAGAVAEYVGRQLAEPGGDVIVENGGDIYIDSSVERRIAVYAGDSPVSGKVAVVIPPGRWGVCTSAGKVGPSLSFGRADAAMVVSGSAILSDAVATKLGNMIKTGQDLQQAVGEILDIPGVTGALGVCSGVAAAAGQLQLAGL